MDKFDKIEQLAASYRPGQQWQYRNEFTHGKFVDMPNRSKPGWFFDTEYQLKPIDDVSITIKLHTVGDHAVEGWWVSKGMPPLPSKVVIAAEEGWEHCMQACVDFLYEQGVKTVDVVPYRILEPHGKKIT